MNASILLPSAFTAPTGGNRVARAVVVGLLTFGLVTAPVANALAQGNSAAAALMDAERDADADTSGVMWFGAGCLFGILGVAAGYLITPTPPAARVIGKAPEYVAVYVPSYQTAGKSIQGKLAIYGCLLGSVGSTIIYVMTMAGAAASTVN